jgi:hypothetical protein
VIEVLIEYRYASADPAQMQTYAAELVGLPAEAVLAGGSLAVAVRQAGIYVGLLVARAVHVFVRLTVAPETALA